ncbi:MAG TPA: hypothetical protein VGI42_07985, partial [Chthoniobacterales bacterium]
MALKKFLIRSCAVLLLAGLLAVGLAPVGVAAGLRLWFAWMARHQGLQIDAGPIEAPLWRPAVLHRLRIASQPDANFQVHAEVERVEVALNLAAIFSRARGRIFRSLAMDGLVLNIRRNPQPTAASHGSAWPILENLLADNFQFSGVQLHIENGTTLFDLHDGALSAGEIGPGVFTAREIAVRSPWLHQNFSQLRGAASWQESRLTLGAITLARGLDFETIGFDLSHLGESRLGLEMNLDAFGGKVRARISSDDHGNKRTWDMAGTASEISLAQMSDALGWTDRASGSLRACKFTFRGELAKIGDATATLWAEVTGLTWRDRTADTIMIGTSLYNREVQVQQLYIKQHNNQLTLTGQSALPQKWSDWLNPDFR